MGELSAVEFVTLDGVMQGFHDPEDHEDGFQHGGWGGAYQDETQFRSAVASLHPDTIYLFGRRTYEQLAAFWPHQPDDNPMAAHLNRCTKYVATRTLADLAWRHARPLDGELVPAVTRIKADSDGVVVVLGSQTVVAQLMEADLIDSFRLFVHPLVLGSGRALFPPSARRCKLRLLDSVPTTTGVLMLSYAVDRGTT
jgi:dihydrofolate reductase